jgi:pimeloyl-ACP methyl ester carboxylesterase
MTESRFHNGSCYRLSGDPAQRPLLVIIHGVGLNQDMWQPWIDVLAPEYNVLTFDLLGHGQSHNPPGACTVRDFVDQLNDLLDHLGINHFALAGFSLGAVISQAYASLFPVSLTHLVLLHSVYKRSKEQCSAVRERYAITLEQGPMATVELAIERWYTEPYRKSHEGEMQALRDVFSRHTDDGYLKAYYLFGHAEPEMEQYPLDRVTCPALVITGSDDTGSTMTMSEALAADLPDAELIINAGHRHMGPAEFSGVMSRQVLSFLIR